MCRAQQPWHSNLTNQLTPGYAASVRSVIVQLTTAVDQAEPALAESNSRTFSRAFADVREAWRHRELWGHLGWQDIKQRYRRSVIGPLWITISMGVTSLALGLLYSTLFGEPIGTFLPYVTAGFIIWAFIVGSVLEGTEVFIANEGLIKHLPAPISVHVFRLVWRQILFFVHNLAVYVVVALIFFADLNLPYPTKDSSILNPGLNIWSLLAIPAFALLAINAVWVSLVFGIFSTRFRDIPPVINSFINLLFFLTPIVWQVGMLNKFGVEGQWRMLIAELNPLYHFVEILRAPMLGMQQSWHHWAVVGAFTIVGWIFALVVLRQYRARVSYWV